MYETIEAVHEMYGSRGMIRTKTCVKVLQPFQFPSNLRALFPISTFVSQRVGTVLSEAATSVFTFL